MENAVKVFKALSNETRLEIIKLLSERSLCVNALVNKISMSQPAISQHLSILENAGLVVGVKKGYWVHYELVTQRFQECANLILELTSREVKDNV
ncbi:TPA: ArsR family transcriptional regulator [bacterium]|nr:ArsR family transcriptional regulator [bacterium]